MRQKLDDDRYNSKTNAQVEQFNITLVARLCDYVAEYQTE